MVWSHTGKKLNSIQSGGVRLTLAAGKTFQLIFYNRSETRCGWRAVTQNHTKQLENYIFSAPCRTTVRCRLWSRGPDQHGKAAGIQPSMEQQLS